MEVPSVDLTEGVQVGGSCLNCFLVSNRQGFESLAATVEPVDGCEQQGDECRCGLVEDEKHPRVLGDVQRFEHAHGENCQ